MINQILNRLTSSATNQGRRGSTRGGGTSRRGGRGRSSRQSTPQNLVSRLLRRR